MTRLHTVNTIHRHTIAEHVYGAQAIAVELCRLNGEQPGPVLLALLHHDAAEVETGDVPAPVKRANEEVERIFEALEADAHTHNGVEHTPLNPREHMIMKAADWFDLAFRCLEERRLGNRQPRLGRTFANVMGYAEAARYLLGTDELRSWLNQEWNRARL